MFPFFPLILYDPMTTYLYKPAVIFWGRKDDGKVEIKRDHSDLHTTGHLHYPRTDSTVPGRLRPPPHVLGILISLLNPNLPAVPEENLAVG